MIVRDSRRRAFGEVSSPSGASPSPGPGGALAGAAVGFVAAGPIGAAAGGAAGYLLTRKGDSSKKAKSITPPTRIGGSASGELASRAWRGGAAFLSKTPLAPFVKVAAIGAAIFAPLTSMRIGGVNVKTIASDVERKIWTYLATDAPWTDLSGRVWTGKNRLTLREYAKALLGQPYDGNVIPAGWEPAQGFPWR